MVNLIPHIGVMCSRLCVWAILSNIYCNIYTIFWWHCDFPFPYKILFCLCLSFCFFIFKLCEIIKIIFLYNTKAYFSIVLCMMNKVCRLSIRTMLAIRTHVSGCFAVYYAHVTLSLLYLFKMQGPTSKYGAAYSCNLPRSKW